jgi:RHS repeat-associated protein
MMQGLVSGFRDRLTTELTNLRQHEDLQMKNVLNRKRQIFLLAGFTCLALLSTANAIANPNSQTSSAVGQSTQNPYTQAILDRPGFREGLIWIGPNPPSTGESAALWNIVTNLSDPVWPIAVESFLESYPASPWSASVHHAYASYCRRTGRITKALRHWEAAWALASTNIDDSAHRIGGTILANWTDLLSSLGRVQELGALAPVGNAWPFVNPQDRERFQGAQDSYHLMLTHPEISFRCGTYALKAIAQALQPTKAGLEDLVEVPSPKNGFSLAGLANLAQSRGMNLIAARRLSGSALVVPSVVHWQQNHYAAIVQQGENGYLVVDPTLDSPKWLPADYINEEASGNFIISAGTLPSGWVTLNSTDAAAIHGQGLPNNVKDGKDKGCKNPPAKKDCPCKGAPVWSVSEPYINAWVMDEPISYLTSRGEEFPFRVAYKQRDTRRHQSLTNEINFVVWTGWNNNSLSTIHLESTVPCSMPCVLDLSKCDLTVFLPEGGEINFPVGKRYDSESQTRLEQVSPGNSFVGTRDNGDNGLRLIHADGSQDIYAFAIVGSGVQGAPLYGDYFRTRHIDPHGNTTWFLMESFGSQGYRVKWVVDYDGKTNRLGYNANSLLVGVTNSYGLRASFAYDGSQNLTSITDAQGLVSTLTYDTNGYPTALITPYGTNVIEYTIGLTNDGNAGGLDEISRAVRVTDPTGAISLYAYRYGSPFMPTNYPASDVPTNTPLGTLDDGSGGTNSLSSVSFRNSFYWNPRQYATLSTTNLASLTTNDYLRARLRHWLQDTNELFLSGLLSLERDASPDGTTEGLKVFYDYQGKIFRHRAGTNDLPSVIAWRLPGGETHYEYMQYNEFGIVTNHATTYTKSDGTLGARTNQLVCLPNVYTNLVIPLGGGPSAMNTFTVPNLLTRVVGTDGSNVWSFGGYDVVSWTNDFPTGFDTNRIVLSSQRILPRFVTNGVGELTQLSYKGFNKLAKIISSSGLTTTNVYDAADFLSRTIDVEVGRTNSFSYTSNGLVAVYTNALGAITTNAWDGLLRLTSRADSRGYISNRYDKLDVAGVRDRMGNWRNYGYDRAGRLTSITNELNQVTSLSWCTCGSLESIVDALGQVTSFVYDQQSRLTSINFSPSIYLTLNYDLAGRVTNVTDSANFALGVGYNNQGLPISINNAFGEIYRTVADIRDRSMWTKNPAGVWVTNTFDPLDRVSTRQIALGNSEGFGYGPAGLLAYTNQLGQVTRWAYDAGRRNVAQTNQNQEVLQFAYDPRDNLTNTVDGKNQKTSWRFDSFSRLTNKFDDLGNSVLALSYDPNNQVTNRWTPGPQSPRNAVLKWDAAGRLTNIVYASSPAISASYDPLGRITSLADAFGASSLTYSRLGALASETGPWPNATITANFGTAHRLASLGITQPNAADWVQSFVYDAAGRMTNTTSPAGSFGYSYIGASPLIQQLILGNGAVLTNSYDVVAQLTGINLKTAAGVGLDSYRYGYNSAHRRTAQTNFFSNRWSYGYDGVGQLTSAQGYELNGTARADEQLSYGYDKAWNLAGRTNNGFAQVFKNDTRNELTNVTRIGNFTVAGGTIGSPTSVTVNGGASALYADGSYAAQNVTLTDGNNTFTAEAQDSLGRSASSSAVAWLPTSTTLSFDANGNLTSDGRRAFYYDDENQLTNVTISGASQTIFVYDGFGRRRVRQEYGWTGSWVLTNEVRYLYHGMQVVQERNGFNLPTVTYTRGLDLSGSLKGAGGIGGLLARTDNSLLNLGDTTHAHAYYHNDGEGNVTALTDGRQNVVARYDYDPFGNLLAMSGPLAQANLYRFSSKEYHPLSGLYYYGSRFYEPNLQRWINRDPIGEAGGLNLYTDVGNSPLNFIDPNGLWSLYNELSQVGQGLYDLMMGDQPGKYDQNTMGAQRADLLGGIDRDNNVLRDSMGEGVAVLGEMGKEAAVAYVGGKVAEVGGALAARAFCKAKPLFGALRRALKPAEKIAKTFSTGEGEGIARITLAEARAAATGNGIDMRAFELVYEPGMPIDKFGYMSQNGAGDIIRAANGRYSVTLGDSSLASPEAAVNTIAHELNHIREVQRLGPGHFVDSEDPARFAGDMAELFYKK